jgi:hypothetical protein
VEAFGKKCLRKVSVYELWVKVRKYYNMLSKSEFTGRIFLDENVTVVFWYRVCG